MALQNAKSYVLSAYPFSNDFRGKVAQIAGSDAEYLTVAILRRRGLWGMARFLRGLNRNAVFYIPLEDPQSESLLPLLLGLTMFSRIRVLAVIDSDGSVRKLSRWRVGAAVMEVSLGTISGIAALFRSYFAAKLLLFRKRKNAELKEDRRGILYLSSTYWFGVRAGGSVGHISGVANAFSDLGFEIDFVSANPQPMLHPNIRSVSIRSLENHGFPQELNFLRFHYQMIRELKRLGRNEYRFLYQRMTVFNFAGVVLSRIWGVPLVLEYNGSEVWCARNWGKAMRFSGLAFSLETICLRHAYRVVVVSQVLADEVVARGVDPGRVICYPNCVDPMHFNPESIPEARTAAIRDRYGIRRNEALVAFVGTFGKWHGAPVLAEAIKKLADYESGWLRRQRVRFAMIGDGNTMPIVRELIGGPKYGEWVVFTGLVQQSETVNYLAACDLLVSPHVANADGSRFFGSPTKLFEYMAMGKGIIASDLDQIGEVLGEGIRIWTERPPNPMAAPAILVRPGNVDDLVSAIKLLIEDHPLRDMLGANARSQLMQKYTWRHHVNHILELLETRRISDAPLEAEGSVLIS